MAPRPLVYVGVGFVTGLGWAALSPGIGWGALTLGLLAAAALPLPLRPRLAAIAVIAGAVWAQLAPAPEPHTPVFEVAGEVTGPVHRHGDRARFRVRTRAGNVRVELRVDEAQRSSTVAIRPCDRLAFRGRPRRRADGDVVVGALSAASVRRRDCWSPWRVADDLHLRLRRVIGDGEGRELVRAMVLGDRSGLSDGDGAAFRAAGLSHVLAVSGLHLAVVTALSFLFVRRIVAVWFPQRAPSTVASLAGLAVALLFTLVTGARVSTVRAFAMAAVVLVGRATSWRIDAASALALVAIVMTAASPLLIEDPAFQLSASATAVLVLAAQRPVENGSGWRRWLVRAVQASLATTLVTAPIVAVHFGEVSVVGVLVNLIAVPLVEIAVVPVGLAGAVLGLWSPSAGGFVVAVAAAAARMVSVLAGAAATWVPMVAGPRGVFEGAACVVAGLWVARWQRPGNRALVAMVVILGAIGVAVGGREHHRDQLRITFVDVGQGDAAIVEFPGQRVWLVDVGPATRSGAGPLVEMLRERGIDTVERVIVSHPHPDHDGALGQLEHRLEVGAVWRARSATWGPERAPPLGTIAVGKTRVVILAPIFEGPRASEDPILSANDNSIVILIEYAGRRVLLSGDVEEEAEDRLRIAYPDLGRVDLIKVPHHGSATSSTGALVDWLRPTFAVISCGRDNRFGHPAAVVVDRWRQAGAEVLRTDRDGDVVATIDRHGTLVVRTER